MNISSQKKFSLDRQVLQRISETVGQENFFIEEENKKPYVQASIPHTVSIAAVIRPASTYEVQKIVEIANQFHIALYPISKGNNWGYGSALPVAESCIVLDLGRMNKILEVNEELAYAIVEPGVSQGDLYRHLKETGSHLQIDPSGAGPNTSLLGNVIERGYGIGLYSDHFAASCGMQVVLGNGKIIETNFGQFDNVRARHAYRWGIGPSIDGLFTQSNFGIVTKMAIWLQRAPQAYEILCFGSNLEAFPASIVEILRESFLQGNLPASCNIVSRNRVLTTKMQYPWDLMDGATPLSDAIAESLASQSGIKLWNGMAPIFGSREYVNATKKVLRHRLSRHVDKLFFLSESKINVLNQFQSLLSKFTRFNLNSLLSSINPLFRLLRGEPLEISLSTPYWRNRHTIPAHKNLNPAADQCGLIWIAPVIPMTGKAIRDFIIPAKKIFNDYRFEFCPTFTAISHRAFDCTLPVLFNKRDENEVSRARECHEILLQHFIRDGFIPYRTGVQSMAVLTSSKNAFWETIVDIKHALDPNEVIAPGRYCPLHDI